MENRNHRTAARLFAETFAAALSGAVAQASGSPWRLELTEQNDPPRENPHPLPFRVKVEGGLNGECFIEFYDPHLIRLLDKTDGDGNGTDIIDGANTLLPVLTTAVAQLKASLPAPYGEVTFKIDRVSELAYGGMFLVAMRVQSEPPSPPTVFLYFDGAMLEALSTASARQRTGDSEKLLALPDNLRLVMDLELNVSLRFGQCQLPLREVLELTSGSVIELDKMVDEPVEMLLDGKVVARGEAVIVDGNYGLRVTEIPQAVESHLSGF